MTSLAGAWNHTMNASRGLAATLAATAVGLIGACSTTSNRLPPPDAGQPRVQAGLGYLDAGHMDEALAEFEAAIAENPQLAVAYLGAADIYRMRGDHASAERGYAEAARLEPRSFRAQYGHGLMLQMLGRCAEAVRAYLRAIEIRPDDPEANLNLATAYLQLGEARSALTFGQRAVALSPNHGPSRVNLGAVYAAMGMYEDAIVEYQQAAELMELTPPLLLNLADSLGHAGRHAEMASTLERLIRTEDSAKARERLGSAYFHLRRYDDALAEFRKSVDLDGAHYPALNGIGVCLLCRYVFSGNEDRAALLDARRAFQRSLRIQPDQPAVIDLLARYR